MKVWEEEEVLRELVAVRTAAAAASEASTNTTNNTTKNNILKNRINNLQKNNKKAEPKRQLPFLLILARKVQRNYYEFIYYPAETYERIHLVFRMTDIETDDGALDNDGDEEEELARTAFEPYYVAKALFHAASGEHLLQIEGSTGWKEALKQKYRSLDAKARLLVEQQSAVMTRNHTAAKAVASAAVGGGAIVGGTSLAAAGMGYTAGGITAGSYAASIMATEAAVSGGSVAAGGFTATMQTIGAVGVMASPVGVTLAAAGAIGGLGTYYMIHRRNKKKKLEEDKRLKCLEEMARELATAKPEKKETNEYQRVAEDEHPEPEPVAVEYWVMVSAKRIELEESEHCFDHDAWDDRVDADLCFLETASNTTAKALFDPQGVVNRIDCDPADRAGWETALRVHYNFLVEQDVFADTAGHHGEHAKEDTPLLKDEEELKERMKKRQIVEKVAG